MAETQPSANQPAGDQPRRKPLPRTLARILQWSVNVVVIAVLLIILTPLGDWLARPLISVDPPAKADWIVVLGGDSERVSEAANLYRQGWARKVIVTSTSPDAKQLAGLAREYGVAEGDIVLDGNAVRTYSHPQTVAALEGVNPATQRFLLVTSLYHTSRARAVFAKAGYADVRLCAPRWQTPQPEFPPKEGFLGRANALPAQLYEFLAWGMYKLSGWV